jgi:capsular exopolysaccharide synthesis family protein
MSRIDEALRRTDGEHLGRAARQGEVFKSAWTLTEPDHANEPEPISPRSTLLAAAPATAPAATPAPAPTPTPVASPRSLLAEEPSTREMKELKAAWTDRLTVSAQANPVLVEQFRRLAASLHHAQTSNGRLKVVMVTSAQPGDGKTLTAVNLALTLSESYRRRVLLIDSDLRRPSITNISHASPQVGLSDGLKSASERKLSVLQLTEMLTFLPGGRPDPDPMGGLTSTRMQHIIEEASSRFDWVILDAPPVGPVADANLLAAMADTVVFVVRAAASRYADVEKAIDLLGRDRIFGVVLNALEPNSNDVQYYAEYHGARKSR